MLKVYTLIIEWRSLGRLLFIFTCATIQAAWFMTALAADRLWTKEYTLEYLMGDGDSRASARQAAVEEIRKRASAEAGTYIQTTTSLSASGELSESIQMIGAAVVHIENLRDHIMLSAEGATQLIITARVSIDEDVLRNRILALQEDQTKVAAIQLLQTDNERLLKELTSIRKHLRETTDIDVATQLLQQQNKTVASINNNNINAGQVFERGTIIAVAVRKSEELDQIKIDLEKEFYQPILKTAITANIEEVYPEGHHYIVAVRVGWKYVANVDRYLNRGSRSLSRFSAVNSTTYKRIDQTTLTQQKIFDYLALNPVSLKITVAGAELLVPVIYKSSEFGGNDCSEPEKTWSSDSIICIAYVDLNSTEQYNIPGYKSNPLQFEISKSQAEKATQVEAIMVRNGI